MTEGFTVQGVYRPNLLSVPSLDQFTLFTRGSFRLCFNLFDVGVRGRGRKVVYLQLNHRPSRAWDLGPTRQISCRVGRRTLKTVIRGGTSRSKFKKGQDLERWLIGGGNLC